MQNHCQHCCHHTGQSSSAHRCSCAAPQSAPRGHQTAYGALSFLQPPCQAQMAREMHLPFEWSLMMRAFASWKVFTACWRPQTAADATDNWQQVPMLMSSKALTGNAQGSPYFIFTPTKSHLFSIQLSKMVTPRLVAYIPPYELMWCIVACHAPSFLCDYAMQVPVIGINRAQDASCGSQGHCDSMMLSKTPYLDNQENAHPWRQQPQSDRSNVMPDWYWLGPYRSMNAKVECHVKPQTIDCLNHLRKQRTAM